jgi:DNA repair ATPase RecN
MPASSPAWPTLHGELYASERAIAARLAEVRRTLEQIARIDPALRSGRRSVENALYGLEEMGREMGGTRRPIEHDPSASG